MLHVPWWSEISPLRFASVEMTEGAGRLFCHLGVRFLHSAPVEMTGMGAGFFIICGEAATTTLGLKGRQT